MLQLINQAKSSSPDNVPNVIASISDLIEKKSFNEKEEKKVEEFILSLISDSVPSIQRSLYSLSTALLNVIDNYDSPTFSKFINEIILKIGIILSASPNRIKTIRQETIDFARYIRQKIGSEKFWKVFSTIFTEKSPYAKSTALELLIETISEDPLFKTKYFIRSVFVLLDNSNQTVKKQAYQIATILYKRNSGNVTKLISNIFHANGDSIIQKIESDIQANEETSEVEFDNMSISSIKSSSSATSISSRFSVKKEKSSIPIKKTQTTQRKSNPQESRRQSILAVEGSFLAASVAGDKNLTPQEIAEMIRSEFQMPLNEIEPNVGKCSFKDLSHKLARQNDWEDRARYLEVIVGYAKGSQNKLQFAKDLSIIQDGIKCCIEENRSALMKRACLCVAAIANALGSNIDNCSNWLLPATLLRAGNDKDVISIPGELASTAIVINAGSGKSPVAKNVKSVLKEMSNHKNEKVRSASANCITIAIDSWPQNLSEELLNVIEAMKSDSSEKVRYIASSFIESLSATRAATKTIKTEDIILDNSYSDNENIDNEDGQYETRGNMLLEEENLRGESLKGLIESKNIQQIATFIEYTNCNLLGYINPIVNIMCENMLNGTPELIQNCVRLVSILSENYATHLYPFLSQITKSLPNDAPSTHAILTKLSAVYRQNAIARLVSNSSNCAALEFVLQYAQELEDNVGFVTKAVFNAITNHHYNNLRDSVIVLLQNVYVSNPIKCEALLSSLQSEDRQEILNDIENIIPQLYRSFIKNDFDPLIRSLCETLTRIQQEPNIELDESKIDSIIDQSIALNQSHPLLLTVALIRDMNRKLNNKMISFLMKCCVNENQQIASSAQTAILKHIEQQKIDFDAFICEFIPSHGSFTALEEILKTQKPNEQVLQIISEYIKQGVNSASHKYSALSVIAFICKNIDSSYLNTYGNLSFVNTKLLQSFMAQ